MKTILFLSLFSFALLCNAQEANKVTIDASYYDNLRNYEKNHEKLKVKNDSLQKEIIELKSKVNEIIFQNDEICKNLQAKEDSIKTFKVTDKEINKRLHNIVSNFLYIPYEAYSIDNIAIKALDAINDIEYKNKIETRGILIRNYYNDINELLSFIDKAEKELNKPFRTENVAKDKINELHNKSFYKNYQNYDQWKKTYLGKRIVKTENILENFSGKGGKINFSEIKKELESCLKTKEIK